MCLLETCGTSSDFRAYDYNYATSPLAMCELVFELIHLQTDSVHFCDYDLHVFAHECLPCLHITDRIFLFPEVVYKLFNPLTADDAKRCHE